MLVYVFRRLAWSIPTLLILVTATFFLLRLAPGGPFDSERVWPAEVQANIERKYELDKPMLTQFAHWLGDLARGDLRESFQYLGRPVSEIISESLSISMVLGGWSLFFAVSIGIPLGCFAAWKRNSWFDFSAVFIAVAGVSLPSYLVAGILVLIFSSWLGWLPPALWEGPESMILPILTLGSRPLAILARLTRATLLETMAADYIRTAYAKGLPPHVVVFKHALKNSMIPVITVMGPIAANLITGSFLVEVVFQIPGMGKHFVQGVVNRDYPLVMGVTLIYGVVLVLSNLVVDVVYGLVDPRIRLS